MNINQIICGNSLDVLKGMSSDIFDAIITSPPYNFGMDYDTHNDATAQNDYLNTLSPILRECCRTLKEGGKFIINIQPNYKDRFPTHHKVTDILVQHGMCWRGEIVWNKNHISKRTAWGSWKSPSSPYLTYPFEFIEVFSKGTMPHRGNNSDIDITDKEFIEYTNGLWTFAPEKNMKKYGHPAMFPEELVRRCLKLYTYKGDFVLDPFNGVGTTTSVCSSMERKYVGIDISEDYCRTAKNRINETLNSVLE